VKISATSGFVGIGTSSFIHAAFDDIQISNGVHIYSYVVTIISSLLFFIDAVSY